MKQNTRNILIHALGIIIFLSIPIFTSPDFGSGQNLMHIVPFQKNFSQFFLLILVFYVNYYFFIPKYYFYKKNKLWFWLSLIIQFAILVLLPNLLFGTKPSLPPEIAQPMPNKKENFFFGEAQTLIPFLLVVTLALLLKINNRLVKLRNEKLLAEVSYLKAQINPHFLFNTLNSLYALTLQKSNDAPQAVLKLSGIMRYVTSESSKSYVSLDKEINYIKDYIDLQKLRLDETTVLHFSVTGNAINKKIAPLLLIPFIENAFKYGVSPEEENEITVVITIEETLLTLWVENTIVTTKNSFEKNTQKGMENTKKRLNFMYEDKHELHILNNGKKYSTTLKLFLE